MIKEGNNILTEHKKHNLEFRADLKQINFLDQRFYKTKEGEYYPSVTTILNYMPKSKFFETWLKDVGHNADLIVSRAAREGTQVHEAAELLLKGETVEWLDDYGNAKYSQIVWEMILKFIEFWRSFKGEIVTMEQFLYSREYKYAGTCDIVVKKDDKLWLLDIKTSNTVHKSHHLQLAAYARAWEELTEDKIDHTGIIWLKSTKRGESKKADIYQGKGWELIQVDNIEENFNLFNTVYSLYRLENPEIEPTFETLPISVKL